MAKKFTQFCILSTDKGFKPTPHSGNSHRHSCFATKKSADTFAKKLRKRIGADYSVHVVKFWLRKKPVNKY